ncbi:hypothetical protein JCGZ_18668 [Jatropha curcas]|uniref:BHLH domain-containing protein n=1 Tax=Jatropha curcas TaxID=180498 RepID=A0A067K3Z5_JATCU|nr:transcription factor bHLH96 [Jatropha curcas]KDP29733.1 hypothetical protein JCGZ_18668 [Jatropha curcas]
MALETVVLQQDLFGTYGPWIHAFSLQEAEAEDLMRPNVKEWDTNSSSQENCPAGEGFFCSGGFSPAEVPITSSGQQKRKRSRNFKNQEEVEHQRMTHITVERNRRKQMNDYLAVLRRMMPPSYVQRGDQASIVGGAINFVKELEQHLQSLQAHKKMKKESETDDYSSLFSDFFSFPQYSTRSTFAADHHQQDQSMAKRQSRFAEIEVTMIENHANLKILLRRHPKQLLKMVVGLSSLSLIIVHLNVTTVGHMVLYSLSIKVEDECQLTSVNEIAAAVYDMVGRIQEEDTSNFSYDC